MTATDTSPDKLLAFAGQLAYDAGIIMSDYFYRTDQHIQHKADKTLVTDADRKVNQLVIDRVNAVYPEHGVLGEEASERVESKQLWVCDPIDGTNGFTTGLPTAVFSLAFVVDGVPQVAVVYNPFVNELFTAIKGQGALCNGQKLQVSSRQLAVACLAGPGGLKELMRHMPVYDQLCRQGAIVRPFGGMVYQCCLVARGKLDGRLFPGYGAHDIAAAKLIVEEAGGKVTDIDGQEQRYDQAIRGAIISNGVVHDNLLQAVRRHGGDDFLGF